MTTYGIGGRRVGDAERCLVIAEAGVNHNGQLSLAHRLVDAAADAGADAVKFQTFRAEALVTEAAEKPAYQRETTGAAESQLAMLRRLELDAEAYGALAAHCRQRGILFLSTPFDEESAAFLVKLGVPALKVSSGEVTNLPFLRSLASFQLPLILSTGMATLDEVREAVRAIESASKADAQLILLHCVSNYPADPRDVNLRAIATMRAALSYPIGYSDHTLGIEVVLAAVALGACVIEKHFTLDRSLAGPDHRASIETPELAALIRGVRIVHSALGDGRKAPAAREAEIACAARRSLVAASDLPAGTRLTREMIAIKRPGTGLPPGMLEMVLGREINRDLEEGTLFTIDVLR